MRTSPSFPRPTIPAYFLWREWYAGGGEVEATTQQLRSAIDTGTKFKELRNSHNRGDARFTNPADGYRYYECPPYFVMAMESDVNIGTMLVELHNATVEFGRQAEETSPRDWMRIPPVDAVFVLGKGAAMLMTTGSALVLGTSPNDLARGWIHVESPDAVLSEFLLWFNACMPRVIRHTPISVPYFMGPRVFTTLDQWVNDDQAPAD